MQEAAVLVKFILLSNCQPKTSDYMFFSKHGGYDKIHYNAKRKHQQYVYMMHKILNKVNRYWWKKHGLFHVSLDSLQIYHVATSNMIVLLKYTLVRHARKAPSYTPIIKSLPQGSIKH